MPARHLGRASKSPRPYSKEAWCLEVVECRCGMCVGIDACALAQSGKDFWIKCPFCGYNIECKAEKVTGYDRRKSGSVMTKKRSILCILGFHSWELFDHNDPALDCAGGDLDPALRRRCKRSGCDAVEEATMPLLGDFPGEGWKPLNREAEDHGTAPCSCG